MNSSTFRVCAIMSSFNEADVLRESIESLIHEGIDVYVLDNCSTDDSVSIAQEYLGKGVLAVETIRFEENGREIYNWAGILQRKASIAQELDHDWFLHVDADEIRQSPWEGLSLKDAFFRVDQSECNLVNFKLFNFRLYENHPTTGPVSVRLPCYSAAESFNLMQVKAWKGGGVVDLASTGGHRAAVANPRVHPTRFILKHYPVRSEAQGIRKINAERKARFSVAEKAKNWHRQYDDLSLDEETLVRQLYWRPTDLRLFELETERQAIQDESLKIEMHSQGLCSFVGQPRGTKTWARWISHQLSTGPEEALLLAEIMQELFLLKDRQAIEATASEYLPSEVQAAVIDAINKESSIQFLEGKPDLAEALLFISNQQGVSYE